MEDFAPATPTPEQAAQLESLSQAFADKLRACLDPLDRPDNTRSIAQLTATLNKLGDSAVDPSNPDHAKLLSLMLEAETTTDDALPNASLIDRLLVAQTPIRAEFVGLRNAREYPIDEIRVYDYEEDADDAAVRILAAIGDDPKAIGGVMVDLLYTPDQKASCLADMAAHKPIPFGRFVDVHPATCWRYYHATQLATAISACPTVSVGARPPQGSKTPSIVDKSPRDLVEKGYGHGQR
jgi:hypothetical protein